MSDPRSSSSLPPQPQPTEVDLTWIAGKIEHRIVFGRSIAERITDPNTAQSPLRQGQSLASCGGRPAIMASPL